MRKFVCLFAAMAMTCMAGAAEEAKKLPVEELKAPEGFHVALYAEGMRSARSLALGDKGTVFVGTRNNPEGVIYALLDEDGDHVAEKTLIVAKGLDMPNGVVFHKGTLYIAEQSQISKIENIEEHLDNPPAPVTVLGGFPLEGFHVWKFITVGPDEKLYYNIGAPCDACSREEDDGDRKANLRFSTIERCNLDGTGVETVARGVRQSVGITFHPETKEMWFTDNGRDKMGDDRPSCELNHLTELGQHFGFPFCHGGDTPDPVLGDKHPCSDFVPPAQQLGPHITPLGLRFYTGDMFPKEYKNKLLIALHGTAERSIKLGYDVVQVTVGEDGTCSDYKPFVEGWLQRGANWGRPVDVQVMPDGALLVSDDQSGAVYRVSYKK